MTTSPTGARGKPPTESERFADSESPPAQTKVEPPAAILANGFKSDDPFPSAWLNFVMHELISLQDHLFGLQLENLRLNMAMAIELGPGSAPESGGSMVANLSRSHFPRQFNEELGRPRTTRQDFTRDLGNAPQPEDTFDQFAFSTNKDFLQVSQDGINGHYFAKIMPPGERDLITFVVVDAIFSVAPNPSPVQPTVPVILTSRGIFLAADKWDPADDDVLFEVTPQITITNGFRSVADGFPGNIRTLCVVGLAGIVTPTRPQIVTSTTGFVWTERTNGAPPASIGRGLLGVTWDFKSERFIAVGEASGVLPLILTSPDGITWTEATTINDVDYTGITGPELRAVEYGVAPDGTEVLVAVGTADGAVGLGQDSIVILFSTDGGDTWDRVFNAPGRLPGLGADRAKLDDVKFINGRFIAVGNSGSDEDFQRGEIMSSFDGVNWRSHQSPRCQTEDVTGTMLNTIGTRYRKVAGGRSGIIVVGDGGDFGDRFPGVWISTLT